MSAPDWTPEVISARERFDITSVLMAPDGSGPDLVTTTDPAHPQSALTSEAATDLARLGQVAGDDPRHDHGPELQPLPGRDLVRVSAVPHSSRSAGRSEAVSKPMARFTGLSRTRMQPRDPFSYRARDGREITGFLTRPSSQPPWPAVLAVHGGPWSRDRPQFDPWAQFMAAAGLCCIQVNYRGSRGFGKEFRDAGDRQWSLAMQDDLVDALQSAAVADVIDADRIAAIGHGYGGYAALMLATQSEVPLACVVSGSAPTDLPGYVAGLLSQRRRRQRRARGPHRPSHR